MILHRYIVLDAKLFEPLVVDLSLIEAYNVRWSSVEKTLQASFAKYCIDTVDVPVPDIELAIFKGMQVMLMLLIEALGSFI